MSKPSFVYVNNVATLLYLLDDFMSEMPTSWLFEVWVLIRAFLVRSFQMNVLWSGIKAKAAGVNSLKNKQRKKLFDVCGNNANFYYLPTHFTFRIKFYLSNVKQIFDTKSYWLCCHYNAACIENKYSYYCTSIEMLA